MHTAHPSQASPTNRFFVVVSADQIRFKSLKAFTPPQRSGCTTPCPGQQAESLRRATGGFGGASQESLSLSLSQGYTSGTFSSSLPCSSRLTIRANPTEDVTEPLKDPLELRRASYRVASLEARAARLDAEASPRTEVLQLWAEAATVREQVAKSQLEAVIGDVMGGIMGEGGEGSSRSLPGSAL